MVTIRILSLQPLLNLHTAMRNLKSIALISLFAVGIVLSGCGKKKKIANPNTETAEVTIPMPEIQKLVVDEGFVPPRENGRFNLERMEMEGDQLKLTVSYSGGCEEHIFNLYSDGRYAKSYPPQLTLFLEHIDNNDRCRAMINKELVFDITGAQYPGTSEVVIKLNNTELNTRYKY